MESNSRMHKLIPDLIDLDVAADDRQTPGPRELGQLGSGGVNLLSCVYAEDRPG